MSEIKAVREPSYLEAEHGILSWLLTTDHKRIAVLYLLAVTFFFVVGGLAASLIRIELGASGITTTTFRPRQTID